MEHSQNYPGRDIESIRRKYNSLHRKQVQTGNPNIPPEILAAKRVKQKIGDKADIGGGEDDNFDLEAGFSGSDGRGQDPPHENENAVPVTIEARTSTAGPRRASPESSGMSVASSRVPRKSKDANQEFLELWRMQMMMEKEERRQERMLELEERREERRQDRRESRERQEQWAGLVSAIVGGIATAFGVEPPTTNATKKRKINPEDEYISSDDD